jgi:hypothetical protein
MAKKFDAAAFAEITALPHSQQGIWWLNGFWDEAEAYAEKVWGMVHEMIEIQSGRPKLYGSSSKASQVDEGSDLDEVQAHVFLEKRGETLTALALRKRLKDVDVDNNHKMALIEYLLAFYGKTPAEVIASPQGGGDPAALRDAQKAVADAASLLSAAQEAKAEVAVAMAAVEAEEKLYNDKIAEQQAIIDGGGSVVKTSAAKNVLAQLKAEDPLPLRKSKITLAAALKKAEKALAAAQQGFDDAQGTLDKLKAQGGVAMGAVWWLERELAERKKYMPK